MQEPSKKEAVKFPIIKAYHHREDPKMTRSFSRRSKSELLRDFMEKDPQSNSKQNLTRKRLPRNLVFIPSFQSLSKRTKEESKFNTNQEYSERRILRKHSEDSKGIFKLGRPPFDFSKNIDKIKMVLQQSANNKAITTQSSEKRSFIPFNRKTSREKLETPEETLELVNPSQFSNTEKIQQRSLDTFITYCNTDYLDRLISYDRTRSKESLSLDFSKRNLKKDSGQDTLSPLKEKEEDNQIIDGK